MRYRIRRLTRYALIFMAWIFCLSIRVGDQRIFDHAHGVLVDNRIVYAIDQELSDLWQRISMTVRGAYARISRHEEEVRRG